MASQVKNLKHQIIKYGLEILKHVLEADRALIKIKRKFQNAFIFQAKERLAPIQNNKKKATEMRGLFFINLLNYFNFFLTATSWKASMISPSLMSL